MSDCLFCRIVAEELKADVVLQDDFGVVIRDIHPQAPVHLLVLPRKHITGLAFAQEVDADILGRLLWLAAEAAREEGVEEGGYRLIINAGENAGQEVHHLHIHVMGGEALGPMRARK